MKFIILMLAIFSVAGCGAVDRANASFTGQSITCVEGLKVVQMTSGAFYQRTPNDKLIACK
jgi:hypothetical protein